MAVSKAGQKRLHLRQQLGKKSYLSLSLDLESAATLKKLIAAVLYRERSNELQDTDEPDDGSPVETSNAA